MNDRGFAIPVLFLVLAALAIVAFGPKARGQESNSEYAKQLLRLQFTEFCAVVGKPPADVAEGINQGVAMDPKRWVPHANWFNRIVEQYKKARCGDA